MLRNLHSRVIFFVELIICILLISCNGATMVGKSQVKSPKHTENAEGVTAQASGIPDTNDDLNSDQSTDGQGETNIKNGVGNEANEISTVENADNKDAGPCATEFFNVIPDSKNTDDIRSEVNGTINIYGSRTEESYTITSDRFPKMKSLCLNVSGNENSINIQIIDGIEFLYVSASGVSNNIVIESEQIDTVEEHINLSGVDVNIELSSKSVDHCDKLKYEKSGTRTVLVCDGVNIEP